MSHRRVNRERIVEQEKRCRFCGRTGKQAFRRWDDHWICTSARACLGRAKVGGYR